MIDLTELKRMPPTLALAFWLMPGTVAPLPAQSPDTIRMALHWEVSEGVHDTADSLGQLSGIAVDRAGVVYVSDAADARIWIFDANGRSLRALGRKGEGPGEFQSPTGIAIGPDGRLYVRDLTHVSRFAADPATQRLTRYVDAFRGPFMSDWTSTLATRFDANGGLYYPAFNVMGREVRTGWFYRFDREGALQDSLEVPAFPGAPASTASVRLSASGGRMLRGLNHVPFAPLPSWDVTPRGTLLTADGRSYLVRETDASGRLVREYRRSVTPVPIPAAERRDSTAAIRARLDSVTVPWSQVWGVPDDVRAVRVPEHYPPLMRVVAGADGRVWVRRWIADGASRTVFDVFDPDGRWRAVVELPRQISTAVTPVLSLDGVAAIAVDPETGAHQVLRFRPARR